MLCFNGVYRGAKPVKSKAPVCPYCGERNTGYWGGIEQHGVQVDGGRNISWKESDRDAVLRRRYGIGKDPHRPIGFRCRAWETFTCTSKKCKSRKIWVDPEHFGSLTGKIAYALASVMKPGAFIPLEADELGRAK